MPSSKVSAGWPYLTKTQFIEGDWHLNENRSTQYTFTFKDGIIGVNSVVWGNYSFIDGWTIQYRNKNMDNGEIIITIEKVGNGKMIWWRTDMKGKKLIDTPLLTWIRQ